MLWILLSKYCFTNEFLKVDTVIELPDPILLTGSDHRRRTGQAEVGAGSSQVTWVPNQRNIMGPISRPGIKRCAAGFHLISLCSGLLACLLQSSFKKRWVWRTPIVNIWLSVCIWFVKAVFQSLWSSELIFKSCENAAMNTAILCLAPAVSVVSWIRPGCVVQVSVNVSLAHLFLQTTTAVSTHKGVN